MKKVITSMLIAFSVFFSAQALHAQEPQLTFEIFQPLPEVDLAAFAFTNGLSGAPRVLMVNIQPAGVKVSVKGIIEWEKPDANNFQELFSFKTAQFTSRVFYNDDIGNSDIKIEESSSNSTLTDENIKRGKPSGKYRVTFILYDASGNQVSVQPAPQVIEFLNPSQTLAISLPITGSYNDAGSVQAQWDRVLGATDYKVKLNVRTSPSQSLEEALDSGAPLIDSKSVGDVVSVNLRSYLDREWHPGDELVMQVAAVIPGPGGGSEVKSGIVNFFIKDNNSTEANTVNPQLAELAEMLKSSIPNNLYEDMTTGKIQLYDLKFSDETGASLQPNEALDVVNYLKAHPDLIIKVTYSPK